MSKKPKSYLFPFKIGRRLVGGIYINGLGNEVYLANRKTGDLNRGAEKTLSAAVQTNAASWGIEEEALFAMRARGVKVIGIKVRETGELWATKIEWFFDRKRLLPPPRYLRGPSQRFLPITCFVYRPGKIRI